MDAVPLAFCSAVVATLETPSSIEEEFSSGIWRTAAAGKDKKRLHCTLYFNYNVRGGWSYDLKQGSVWITFLELKKLNKRDLRIMDVFLYNSQHRNKSSFEEILEIVNYTLPCVNMAELSVHATMKYPQEDLLKLLSIYKHSAFQRISTTVNDSPVSDFILPHLTSELLKNFRVHGAACSRSFKEAMRDAALHKQWNGLSFEVDNAEFDLDFLEEMFQKPVTQEQEYHFTFSFEISALKNFKRDWRTSPRTHLEWIRPDGVIIDVRHVRYGNVLSVSFLPLVMYGDFCW